MAPFSDRLLTDATDVGFAGGSQLCFVLEPSGVIRAVTQALNVGDLDPQQFVGQNMVELAQRTAPADRAAHWVDWLSTAAVEMAPRTYVEERQATTGEWPYAVIATTLIPVPGPDGSLDSIIAWVKDETLKRENAAQERALRDAKVVREEREQLATALEMTGLGRYDADFQASTLDVDERFTEILGRDVRASFRERGPEEYFKVVHEDDRDRVRDAVQAAAPDEPFAIEYRINVDTPQGRDVRWISSLGRVERNERGLRRVYGLLDDITDRRQEDALRVRVLKLEAVSTLAGGIAHDFNNVISAILSNAQLAQHETTAGDPPTASITEIQRGAERAADLVRRLLSFSREEAPVAVPFDLGEIVGEACALLQAGMPASVVLRPSISPGELVMVGDPTQLHQVVINLVGNAAQAIGEGPGRIAVALDHCDPGDERKPGEVVGPHLCLVVRDDGPGIAAPTLRRIFDPFFTTKKRGEGTGLGLAATQSIVHNHEGTIAVESQPGEGATFTVALPLRRASRTRRPSPAREPGGPAAATSRASGPRVRVLFVDDEQALTRLARRALAVDGCDARAFTDPHAALAAFTAAPGDFDVLITDLSMPGLTGTELAAAVRAIRPELPVVITSGFISTADELAFGSSGIDAVVPKPCSMSELAAAARGLMRARRESPA